MNLRGALVERSKKLARIILLSLAIGAIVGYLCFYLMMPSVVVPETTNPSFVLIAIVLLAAGLLVGMLSADLEAMAIQMLLGMIVGVIIAWLLFIAPSINPDIIIPGASGYIYNVLHASLPVILLGLAMLFVGGFIGTSLMEGMMSKGLPSPFDAAETEMREGQHNQ